MQKFTFFKQQFSSRLAHFQSSPEGSSAEQAPIVPQLQTLDDLKQAYETAKKTGDRTAIDNFYENRKNIKGGAETWNQYRRWENSQYWGRKKRKFQKRYCQRR